MRLDLIALKHRYEALQGTRGSDQSAARRSHPRLADYDYLALRSLREDVERLIARVEGPGRALDVGSGASPYRQVLEARRLTVETLDLSAASSPDHVGSADRTGLPSESFNLVVCTQVVEHVDDPSAVITEIARILRPGGHLILSAPHVWFFHPHPHDYWRFTQQGIVRLVETAGLEPLALHAQGGSVLAFCQVANFLAYGVLGSRGAPVYAALNLAARLDRALPDDLFCLNFACLAQKNGAGA